MLNTKKITTKRTREYKLIAGALAASGLVIAALAFLTPQVVGTGSSGAGTTTSTAYTTLNMLLALLGGFMFATGAAFILFKQDAAPVERGTTAEPASPTIATATPSAAVEEETVQPVLESESVEQAADLPPIPNAAPEQAEMKESHLVLRLLSGDERTVFRAIVEAGGEVYQKDIVTKTMMSDAKVSRVLDKLVERGVIVKERHGMSNKVRIEIEE